MPMTPEGFAKRIDRLREDLVMQGRRVQSLLEAAFDALFANDTERAAGIENQDTPIDDADVAIEKAAVQLLTEAAQESAALEQGQLRMVLTIAKVNNELERIADAAVDVSELTRAPEQASTFPDTFKVMANSVVGILRDTNASMQKSDPALAKVVLQSQHTVTAFKAAILRDAEERIARGTMSVDQAFRLHEIASQCELIADHCTNIAEQVIYVTTGAIVRHTETSWVEVPRSN